MDALFCRGNGRGRCLRVSFEVALTMLNKNY